METLMSNFKRYSILCGIFFLGLSLSNCSSDDDVPVVPPTEPTGSIVAENQTISQNTLEVQTVNVSDDAWLIVRKVNEDNTFSDIIGGPVLIEEGTQANLEIELDDANAPGVDLEDGDTLALMLHVDDGDGVFDENDDDTIDDATGNPVTETVVISSPQLSAVDQDVVDNTITFENVNTRRSGWVVVHNQDAEGNIDEDDIVARQYVEAGANEDVVVTFDDDFTFTPGQTVFPRLHLDDPADQEFTFETDPETDRAETFGFGEDTRVQQTGFVVN